MQRWQIGDVQVARIVDVELELPAPVPAPEWAVPAFAVSPAEVRIAFSALALIADGLRIVVDPWLANDGPRRGPDPYEHATRLLGMLGTAGIPPAEVDVVVNTHLDGIGWNTRPGPEGWEPSFPGARVIYPADEVAAIQAGEQITGVEGYHELAAATIVEAVTPPLRLSPSVTLVDAPGHSWGHVAVRIESGGDLAIYAGHLFLSTSQIDDPDRSQDDGDRAEIAVATRRGILDELADRGGVLLTTLLGGPGGGRVVRTSTGFALETE